MNKLFRAILLRVLILLERMKLVGKYDKHCYTKTEYICKGVYFVDIAIKCTLEYDVFHYLYLAFPYKCKMLKIPTFKDMYGVSEFVKQAVKDDWGVERIKYYDILNITVDGPWCGKASKALVVKLPDNISLRKNVDIPKDAEVENITSVYGLY